MTWRGVGGFISIVNISWLVELSSLHCILLFLYFFIAATGPGFLTIWTLQCNILTVRLTSSKMINITSLTTKHWQFRRTNQAIRGTRENTGLAVGKETVPYCIQKITLPSNKINISRFYLTALYMLGLFGILNFKSFHHNFYLGWVGCQMRMRLY